MKAIATAVVFAVLYPAAALGQSPGAPAPESRVLVQPPGAGFKAITKDTKGAYSLAENRRDPGSGVDPHTHGIEDESFYVIEGNFTFQIGSRSIEAPAGTFVFGPKGVRHSYKNTGTTPGRLLVLSSPAGFEKFLEERAVLDKQVKRDDPSYAERWKALQEKYKMQY